MSLPSESQVLQLFQGTGQQQYTMKRLIQHFTVAVEERPAFRDAIRAMVARGKLVLLHGTRYALPQRLDTLAGVVRRHADGYGFVVPDDEQEDDIYLPRRAMQGVMHGDRVLVRLETRQRYGERRSGRVVQVLERGQQDVVGRVVPARREPVREHRDDRDGGGDGEDADRLAGPNGPTDSRRDAARE